MTPRDYVHIDNSTSELPSHSKNIFFLLFIVFPVFKEQDGVQWLMCIEWARECWQSKNGIVCEQME